ncbi:hypothetical protein KR054_001522 [Drosophila jambulina]|nr:hypothetical protein KR054_001522 [Drosophila jambulina]
MSVRSDGGTVEPPAKRSRHSMVVPRIHETHSQLNIAKDMINSSFDIVTRLRTIEREGAKGYVKAPDSSKQVPTSAQPSEPRHVMDLFFESVASTMKSLPTVLAAEGKAKIMQLVCGLEVRAIHRKTPAASKPSNTAAEPSSASVQAAAAANDHIMQTNNNNDMESTPNNSGSGARTPSLTINGNPEDLPGNTRGIPSQLLVTSRNDPNSVRCVPLYKLTTQSVNGNERHSHGGSLEEPPMPGTEINNANTQAE